jgi:AGCS family alanine or glycine:cation symporter
LYQPNQLFFYIIMLIMGTFIINYFIYIGSIMQFRDLLWSGPLLILFVFVGLYQTFKLRGLQFRCLKQAFGLIVKQDKVQKEPIVGDISSFQTLMTSLAGAIGTGNIAGIATAISVGGFGALFWMWVVAFLGMATTYSETLLSVKYRVTNKNGAMAGGPMYTLARGLKAPKLAACYAFFGAIAAFGIGNLVQANSVAHALTTAFPISNVSVGLIMMVVTGAILLGGITRIGRFAEWLVPFKALLYLSVGIGILIVHYDSIGKALWLIVSSAFSGQAAVGGFMGSSFILAVQYGVTKGVFSNEAGLGSLAIAAASAKTEEPVEQGLLAISGVFISTMLVCTVTGLVLAVTGVLGTVDSTGHLLTGSSLVMAAFGSVAPGLQYVVVIGLILFALTTVLAWGYYGEKCVEYLFGLKIAYAYRWVYTVMIFIGALLKLELVWAFADLANGFMAIPNLIAIIGLSRIVQFETRRYFNNADVTNDFPLTKNTVMDS